MAIDTIITKISKDDRATVISMLFTDNAKIRQVQDFREEHFNLENFKAKIRSVRDSLAQVDDPDVKLVVGPFDPTGTPPVVVVPPEPTPEELARKKFFEDLTLQLRMKRAIDLGLKNEADSDYVDQVRTVKSEFKPEYVPFLF